MHLENCKRSDELPPVQKSLDMTYSNGCKVTLIFGNKSEEEIRHEVAEMLLAAFQRMAKESKS